jgi:hypothetical protein
MIEQDGVFPAERLGLGRVRHDHAGSPAAQWAGRSGCLRNRPELAPGREPGAAPPGQAGPFDLGYQVNALTVGPGPADRGRAVAVQVLGKRERISLQDQPQRTGRGRLGCPWRGGTVRCH